MTLPRSQLISPAQTPYYHCIAHLSRTKILQTLGLNDAEWQHLALALQKKAIRAMNGWDRIAKLREQQNKANKVSQ